MAHLVVSQDGRTQRIELSQPVTMVGRSPKAGIQILDTKASREHARIEECARGYKLIDLESANGTIVNGARMAHKILEAGDRIEIGATLLVYEAGREDLLKARRLDRRGEPRKRSRPAGMPDESNAASLAPAPPRVSGNGGVAKRTEPPGEVRQLGDEDLDTEDRGDGADSAESRSSSRKSRGGKSSRKTKAAKRDLREDAPTVYDVTAEESDGTPRVERATMSSPDAAPPPSHVAPGLDYEPPAQDASDDTDHGLVGEETALPNLPPQASKAELVIQIRRLLNQLLVDFDDDGAAELERILADYLHGGLVEPYIQHLVEHRDIMVHLLEINQAINGEMRLETLLVRILDETVTFTEAERGFLILLNDEGKPRVRMARSFGPEDINAPDEKFSQRIVAEVIQSRLPLLSSNAAEDFLDSHSIHEKRLRSVCCVPLRARGDLIGVLYIDNRYQTGVFTERDLLYLEAIADQAAIAITKARLLEELSHQKDELAKALDDLKGQATEITRLNELLEERVDAQEQELSAMVTELNRTRAAVRKSKTETARYPTLIGTGPAMQKVFGTLDRVAGNDKATVLIQGEMGTGKELVARAVHDHSPRKDRPFIAENCAAIPDTLAETIFFGAEKGAYTSADKAKPGLFEQADGGTLFLDEVGDMPMDLQKKLLRVLETHEVRRVGGQSVRKVDVRIVAATNRDLRAMMADGRFREDLFYRLNVVGIELPSLSERAEDIPDLLEHFLESTAKRLGIPPKPIDPELPRLLSHYPWPGNVRELQNAVQAALTLSGPLITLESFSDEIREALTKMREGEGVPEAAAGATGSLAAATTDGQFDDMPLKDAVRVATEIVERRLIARALEAAKWKKIEAAERLGISRPTLDAKIEAYDLRKPPDL